AAGEAVLAVAVGEAVPTAAAGAVAADRVPGSAATAGALPAGAVPAGAVPVAGSAAARGENLAGVSRVLALRGGEIFERGFAPLPLGAAGVTSPRIRPGGTYLITGGRGGIGLTLARELARQGPVKLVLTGRGSPVSPVSPAAAAAPPAPATLAALAAIAELEAAGAEVMQLAADVADPAAMAAALSQAEEHFGPLHGVIHAAGVAGGGIAQWKTPEAARQVLAAKLDGTLVLDALLRGRDLDFFLICSSITAVAGGFGQSDYCAANACCDAYAQAVARRDARRGRLTVAVGWDRWEEVGMAARAGAAGAAGAAAGAGSPGSVATGHPLLGTCVAGAAERAVFRSWLSPESHWVLSEHQVAGMPTVPGTTYLEMARAALAFVTGDRGEAAGRCTELRDVVFLNPLAVPPGQTREVLTVLTPLAPRPAAADAAWSFRVVSRLAPAAGNGSGLPRPGADEETAWQEHARGEVAAVAAAASSAGAPAGGAPAGGAPPAGRRSGGGLADGAGREVDLAPLAAAGAGFLRTGPRWRSLRRLVVGEGEGVATLELAPELAADLAACPLHPALLDLAAGAVRLTLEGSFLPLAYQRLRLFAPLPPRCRSHYRLHPPGGPAADTDLLTCDVTVLDAEDQPIAEIEGFTMRRLSAAAVAQLGQAAPPPQPPPMLDAVGAAGGPPAARPLSYLPQVGILPAEGAEVCRRILGLEMLPMPHLVVSTAPLAAVMAAADAPRRREPAE
ncbi:MAG TPA: SDR family NAD(P)-dependent oxidoreductase, partial [Thermoanaerobaculia bacterium]|nr:SDR family NAD(P)-dependent oxidoreductase [Thermoanaerobaculia bacterium]